MPLSEAQNFAGYRIVRLLGSGGMGEVYLAEHPRLPRRDALKVLPADVSADPEYRARFEREADLASKLWHPHIVSVHDRGEYEGQLWISMDFVDGLDAARLLGSRYPDGMPPDQVVRIITAVASALDYAHKQGLLHRDVKPANIMLTHFADDDDDKRVEVLKMRGEYVAPTHARVTVGELGSACWTASAATSNRRPTGRWRWRGGCESNPVGAMSLSATSGQPQCSSGCRT
jgi:serine/threonine protein kinase